MTRRSLVMWVFSGVALGSAFVHPALGPLFVIGSAILIHSILKAITWKEVVISSFLAGIGRYGGALIWVWNTYPLTWLGIAPKSIQLALIGAVWLTNVVFLALSVVVVALVCFYLYRRDRRYLFGFPIIFLFGEILGSFIFSIYSLGPGSSLNIGFSFGYGGYTLGWLPPSLAIASVGGAYALSLFATSLGTLLYAAWFKLDFIAKKHLWIAIAMLLVWLSGTNIYVHQREEKSLDEQVVAIGTYFDANFYARASAKEIQRKWLQEAVEAAMATDPDLILLPEDTRFVSSFQSADEIFNHLYSLSDSGKTLLVDSSRAEAGDDTILRAYVFDLGLGHYYAVDKQTLVPQGEYLPYLFTWWLKVIASDDFIDKVLKDRSYRPGPVHSYAQLPDHIPSVLFCFESVVPTGVKHIKRENDLVLHPVSHAWFNDSRILRQQLDMMLRVQAIWNNSHIVQAGNMAPTLIYYPDGGSSQGEIITETEYYSIHRFQ